jgi:DNA-binding transcriptional LysR family regulator
MSKVETNWHGRIGRRLRLRDLHVLLAVAQSRSMAKAARELSVSQPAVSQAIADLEQTLGVRLLDRNPRGIEPTAYGRALLQRSLAVFDELVQAVRDIEFLADPTQGELHLGCPESIVATFIHKVVEDFARQNPRVILKIEQIHDVSPHFRELRDRQVDLVIARVPHSFAADDLRTEILLDEQYSIAAGTTSRLARRRKLAMADLLDEPWVLPSPDTLAGSLMRQAFQSNGLESPAAAVVTLSTHLRCSLIGSGHFLGMLPASVLRLNAERFGLMSLPVRFRSELNPIAIVTLKDRTLSPLVQRFVNSARTIVKSLSPIGTGTRETQKDTAFHSLRGRPRKLPA